MRSRKLPEYEFEWGPTPATLREPPAKVPANFSPPLIAMVVVVGTAFLIVTYFRVVAPYLIPPCHRFCRRRCRFRWFHRGFPSDSGIVDEESLSSGVIFHDPETAFHLFSPYGLDEAVIKTIPLCIYTKGRRFVDGSHDCAVCLLEFEENDYLRILPKCSHAFHIDCIDIWLRSHANCPLCRARIFLPESPFIPVMAARIRPSLEDIILLEANESELPENDRHADIRSQSSPEGSPANEDPVKIQAVDREENDLTRQNCFLKRSYSFGFESSLAVDRLVLESATASPWRYRRGSIWSKRFSPFSSKPRVFSFRYRGLKSPFFRRRSSISTGFFPFSDSNSRFPGGSSRRTKSMTSPLFMRSVAVFSSSRLRCGDPEALLSPERLNRR